jgi:hypothetical protein
MPASARAVPAQRQEKAREVRTHRAASRPVGRLGTAHARAAADANKAAVVSTPGTCSQAGGPEEALVSEADIRAAAASIRAWRYVQAHTAQQLAELLSAHPEAQRAPPPSQQTQQQQQQGGGAAGGAAASGPAAGGGGGAGPGAAAGAGPEEADAATLREAAAAKAAELRSYVASRVEVREALGGAWA